MRHGSSLCLGCTARNCSCKASLPSCVTSCVTHDVDMLQFGAMLGIDWQCSQGLRTQITVM